MLEGEPIGTGVTRVNAIDKDGTFPNNQVKLNEITINIFFGYFVFVFCKLPIKKKKWVRKKRKMLEIKIEYDHQVYYGIVDSPRNEGKDYFEINEQTGEIFTKIVFDREKQAAYALEVEARDGAPSARPNSNGLPNTG